MRKLLILLSLFSVGASSADFSNDVTKEDLTERECMALNIYHESRSESTEGQLAVAYVTLNRVFSKNYPFTICEVVFQRKQFSWTADKISDKVTDIRAWRKALKVADYSFKSYINYQKINDNALFYHTNDVSPYWSEGKKPLKRIDKHVFY